MKYTPEQKEKLKRLKLHSFEPRHIFIPKITEQDGFLIIQSRVNETRK